MATKKHILIAFIFWCIITLILVLSVVGIILMIPQINATDYYKPQDELRSSWMRIGVDLKDKLIS